MDIVTNGQIRPSWAVTAVDTLLEKVRTKPMWEVIDFIVSVFVKNHPEYLKDFHEAQKDRRKTLKNPHGSTKSKEFRHLVAIPQNLSDLIEYFYKDDIHYNSKRFWREFARRYPAFSVPETKKI
jgi:hypothetical protein